MAWPVSQDYNEAVQNPATSFADPDLRLGQPVVNQLGLPMPRSGAAADVYEIHSLASQTRWAVKCFTRAVPGLRERYAEISKHLKDVRLPFFVDFNYLDEGIRIRGEWYPVVKMQWVEGLLLNEFLRAHADKSATLEALSQIWMKMARRLREVRLAHGDLQHGNVLLVPGSKTRALAVKLIDYDGMWVPALAQKRPGEVGHPAYQHPQRAREGTYNAELDRFPALLVATVLRCLLAGGTKLWERYDNGDNLLFREADLRAPGESALFKELWQLPDVPARALVGQLMLASRWSLEQVPLLEELFADGNVPALSPEREKQVETLFETARRVPAAPVGVAAGQAPLLLAPQHPVTPYRIATADAPPPPRRRPPRPLASERWTQLTEPPIPERRKLLLTAIAVSSVLVVGTLVAAAIWKAGRPPAPLRDRQEALASRPEGGGTPDQITSGETPPRSSTPPEPQGTTGPSGGAPDQSASRPPSAVQPSLPDAKQASPPLSPVLRSLKPGSYSGRTGAAREELLREGQGNQASEDAVADGLKWIVRQQKRDGHWSLEGYDPGFGVHLGQPNDPAATALALLPLLGNGATHKQGQYRENVQRGIDYLRRRLNRQGFFGTTMYAQGLATIALCEAYGLTGDEQLREPAQRAVNFVVRAQHKGGGWRYEPNQPGDTSVTGWLLVALKTGEQAGLYVPKETFQGVSNFLDSVARPDGGYGYTGPADPASTTGAIGVLARLYLGSDSQSAELLKGVELLERMPPSLSLNNAYYYYYATQVMRHVGGRSWQSWNPEMRDLLIRKQNRDKAPGNRQFGSWSPTLDEFGKQGGRLMVTSLSLMTLEVYYRHVPFCLRSSDNAQRK